MTKLKLILFLLFGMTNFAWATYTSNIFVSGKTSLQSVEISSATVNFVMTDVQFSCDGAATDFCTVTSSWAKTTSDYIYVTPSHDFKYTFPSSIDMRGNPMRMKITIPAGDTFYYFIGGHK